MEPITNEEKYLAALTGESVVLPDPITRKEIFLAAAAGVPVSVPDPITREEIYLSQIKPGYGTGVVLEPLTVTENGEYTPGEGVDGFDKVTVEVAASSEDLLAAMLTNTLTEYSNSEITSIPDYAFYGLSSLKIVSFPAVTVVGEWAFRIAGISALEEYDFKNVTTIKNSAFYGLPLGDITDENFPNLYEIYSGGLRSISATKIKKPNSTLKIHGTAFETNPLLKTVDIWAAEWGAYNQSLLFQNCHAFDTFIIRRTDMVNPWCGWSSAFNTTLIAAGTGYIYVPSALVDAYKAATGWADWAEQIRAIEDYPEITGG